MHLSRARPLGPHRNSSPPSRSPSDPPPPHRPPPLLSTSSSPSSRPPLPATLFPVQTGSERRAERGGAGQQGSEGPRAERRSTSRRVAWSAPVVATVAPRGGGFTSLDISHQRSSLLSKRKGKKKKLGNKRGLQSGCQFGRVPVWTLLHVLVVSLSFDCSARRINVITEVSGGNFHCSLLAELQFRGFFFSTLFWLS